MQDKVDPYTVGMENPLTLTGLGVHIYKLSNWAGQAHYTEGMQVNTQGLALKL